jgi:hypothetical protein
MPPGSQRSSRATRPTDPPASGARGVTHVVISGGAFRHAEPAARDAALAALLADPGTRGLIGHATAVLDEHYVLAPAGLLATAEPPTAEALLRRYLLR